MFCMPTVDRIIHIFQLTNGLTSFINVFKNVQVLTAMKRMAVIVMAKK